jgi:hypothetical protein
VDFDRMLGRNYEVFGFFYESRTVSLGLRDATGSINELTMDLSSTLDIVDVCFDFLHRPAELLDLYSWKLNEVDVSTQPSASSDSSQAAYVAPVVTTTFIVTEGFDF